MNLEEEFTSIARDIAQSSGNICRHARRVMAIGEQWEARRAEVGDVSFGTFLVNIFGRGRNARWWAERAKAWELFGRTNHVHHDGLVWLMHHLPDRDAKTMRHIRDTITNAFFANRKNPLTVSILYGIFPEMVVRKTGGHDCRWREFVIESGLEDEFAAWSARRGDGGVRDAAE
jgi:hypothetical protein